MGVVSFSSPHSQGFENVGLVSILGITFGSHVLPLAPPKQLFSTPYFFRGSKPTLGTPQAILLNRECTAHQQFSQAARALFTKIYSVATRRSLKTRKKMGCKTRQKKKTNRGLFFNLKRKTRVYGFISLHRNNKEKPLLLESSVGVVWFAPKLA